MSRRERILHIKVLLAAVVIAVGVSTFNVSAGEKDTVLPQEYIDYIEGVSEIYNVCPELIEAIIEKESSCNINAVNNDCVGLMQVSVRWHSKRADKLGADLYDPKGNILVGIDYLMELADKYEDLPVVLAVYNGDKRALEEGYVSDYAQWIMNRSMELEVIHYGM